MKRFSEDHQWVQIDQDMAVIGITAYAAEELGEITFVEVPDVGAVFGPGDTLCVVESSKAAADLFVPIGGTVKEVNAALEKQPALINASPEGDGWICKLEDVDSSELDALMTEEQYERFVEADGDDGA